MWGYRKTAEPKTVNVFCFPDGNSFKDISEKLDSLRVYIDTERGIKIPYRLVDGFHNYRKLFDLLAGLCRLCENDLKPFDFKWLQFLRDTINGILPSGVAEDCCQQFSTWRVELRSLFKEASENSIIWPDGKLFIIAPQVNTLEGGPAGAHGLYDQRNDVVIIRNYKEIVYHEFLHLFGVREGYTEGGITKPGCEKCWMQWEPSRGNGLCDLHSNELGKHIGELSDG